MILKWYHSINETFNEKYGLCGESDMLYGVEARKGGYRDGIGGRPEYAPAVPEKDIAEIE